MSWKVGRKFFSQWTQYASLTFDERFTVRNLDDTDHYRPV